LPENAKEVFARFASHGRQ